MTNPQPELHHEHVEYNPFDGPPRKKLDKKALAVAIIVSAVLWTGLLVYM